MNQSYDGVGKYAFNLTYEESQFEHKKNYKTHLYIVTTTCKFYRTHVNCTSCKLAQEFLIIWYWHYTIMLRAQIEFITN